MKAVIVAVVVLACSYVVLADVGCTATAPCLELPALLNVANSQNTTLFGASDEACGGNTVAAVTAVLPVCIGDVAVPNGCQCISGAACIDAVSALPAACKEALVASTCENAYWFEPTYKVNLRNLVLHIVNDCGGAQAACAPTIPPFNPAVCSAAPPPAPTNKAGAVSAVSTMLGALAAVACMVWS